MGTRGRIGIEHPDGSITSVYHHYDSYESWLGVKLNEHYNTTDKVFTLIAGGDMSCCYDSDENPTPRYYSERGENCPPRHDDDYHQYTNKDAGEEYHYIWTTDEEWICIDQHQFTEQTPELVQIPGYEVA
jgi:hypothetical protein